MHKVIEDHAGFAFTPTWFRGWLSGSELPQEQRKEYDRCYSGYYRVAISPWGSTGSSHAANVGHSELVETSSAWISFCTYRRYDAEYGCAYPGDLRAWCLSNRGEALKRINPAKRCSKVICCRHEHNRQILHLISSSSSTPVSVVGASTRT